MLLAALLLVQCSVHQIEFFMAAPCRREKKQHKKARGEAKRGEDRWEVRTWYRLYVHIGILGAFM